MYRAREQEDILTELQGYSNLETSKIEGTFENDILAANSIEFAKIEVELEQAYKAAFAETSWGEYLTRKAAEFGVDRKSAQKAAGIVVAEGNGQVPEGSQFATLAGTIFEATENVLVNGSAEIPVQAVVAGAAGNVAANTVSIIPMNIPGIHSINNPAPMHDGYDEESDKDLLARYYAYVRTPATSGNKYHYYNWAMSVPGVGDCRVIPLWNGPGTVKVLIMDSNRESASDELIQEVYNYIETVRPIGATVTVVSPVMLPVTISIEVLGLLDEQQLLDDINDYLDDKGLDLKYLSAAKVVDCAMNQKSVEDVGQVLLNGVSRIVIDKEELLTAKEVQVNGLTS